MSASLLSGETGSALIALIKRDQINPGPNIKITSRDENGTFLRRTFHPEEGYFEATIHVDDEDLFLVVLDLAFACTLVDAEFDFVNDQGPGHDTCTLSLFWAHQGTGENNLVSFDGTGTVVEAVSAQIINLCNEAIPLLAYIAINTIDIPFLDPDTGEWGGGGGSGTLHYKIHYVKTPA